MYSAFQNSNTADEFRSILATSIDGFLKVDMTGHILETNFSYCQMVGYTRDQLLNMHLSAVDAIDSAEDVAKRFKKIIQYGSLRFNTKHRHKDGPIIDVEISANYSPLHGGSIFSFLRDISHQKQAKKALREIEDKYRIMFDCAGDSISVMTMQGKILAVNPLACKMLGYTNEEMMVMSIDKLDSKPELLPENINIVLVYGHYKGETELVCKDGSTVPVSVDARKIVWDGQPAIMSICRDITERKEAEKERLMLERKFLHAQKLESLGIMAGGIAHDFNNLLQSIHGNLELAKLKLDSNSASQKYISYSMRSAERAVHLTDLMLTYVGKGLIVKNNLSLNKLISENAEMFRTAASASVSIELSLSAELPDINADEAQIQQIIMNLITNAAESIQKQQGYIWLKSGIRHCDKNYLSDSLLNEKSEPGLYVYLEVKDNGCGMSEETLKRLFDPFFTTKFTGRGLGMSAVMGIIKSHGGALFVESEPGQGTAFTVLFPISEMPSSAKAIEPITSPAEKHISQENALSGVVLVVDDEKSVLRTCAKMVQLIGFDVITAHDGIDAVAKYSEHQDEIDVVLMDSTMPNMNGLTAMSEIYRIRPDIKVILASGFNEDELSERITSKPPSGFIRKPFSMRELETEIRRVMQGELPVK